MPADFPEITWPGKGRVAVPTSDGSYDYRWVDPGDPEATTVRTLVYDDTVSGTRADPDPETARSALAGLTPTTDNLAILGESGQVLAALTEDPDLSGDHLGKVKLCYIDPPFNTGGTFSHYDDALDPALWLGMMSERLQRIRRLLTEDGTVWVHLDESQSHRTRMLLDEVFGTEGFVAEICVNLNPSGRRLGSSVAKSYDRILVYAKGRPALDWKTTEGVDVGMFPHRTEDGTPYRLLPLRNFNHRFTPMSNPSLAYPLYGDPDTGQVSVTAGPGLTAIMPVFGDLSPAVWRWGRDKASRQIGDLVCRTVRGRMGARVDIYQRDYCGPDRRRALTDIWLSSSIGSSVSANREIKTLFPSVSAFDTPKPERLLARIIGIATSPGDLVLDVFGGSGTTAAVAHKMGRRWVTCELSEYTYSTFLVPRLTKVVTGNDPGGVTTSPGGRVDATADGLPAGLSPEEAAQLTSLLTKVTRARPELGGQAARDIRSAVRTRPGQAVVNWLGGGSFRTAHLAPAEDES